MLAEREEQRAQQRPDIETPHAPQRDVPSALRPPTIEHPPGRFFVAG
jgi:hypothetical protein